MNTEDYKIEIVADIELQDETSKLKKAVASVIEFPDDKQIDLQYFTAIYVSTGTNLNYAHFLASEIVKAKDTITSKALDIEHEEESIIGHIYDYAFIRKDGDEVSFKELSSMETAELDNTDMHVVMAGIIYKNRFPEIAKEVAGGKWKVSMECYYSGYDVKVGDLVLDRRDAEALGLSSEEGAESLGKRAKVIKEGKEVADGEIARILRGICFSGCGIVKNPANPPSIILEVAGKDVEPEDDDTLVLDISIDYVPDSNNVTSSIIGDGDSPTSGTEDAELQYSDTVGICVSFKKEVYAEATKGPDTEVLHENWCSLYDEPCTAFGADATDINCLTNQKAISVANACITRLLGEKEVSDRRSALVDGLSKSLDRAKSLL